jgi:putative transposase
VSVSRVGSAPRKRELSVGERAVLEAWRTDYNNERPHSRPGWMSPAIYAAARRSAALRSTDGSAPRIAATTAQQGITDDQTSIATG